MWQGGRGGGCAGNCLDRQARSVRELFPRGKCAHLMEEKMLAKQRLSINILPHLQGLYYCSHREFHFLLLGCLLAVTMLESLPAHVIKPVLRRL